MKNEMQLLQALLDKYRFTRPVPPGVRGRILARKRRNFVAIMKKLGRHNIVLGAFLVVYFLLRRIGIVATLKQCGVVLVAASLFTAAGAGVGGYIAVKHLLDAPVKVEEGVKDDAAHPGPVLDAEKDRPAPDDAPPPLREVKNAMSLQPFEADGAPAEDTALVSNALRSELVRLRGIANVLTAGTPARLILIGTVRRMGGGYTLTARVVDRETGRIRYATALDAPPGALAPAAKKLAREISKNIE